MGFSARGGTFVDKPYSELWPVPAGGLVHHVISVSHCADDPAYQEAGLFPIKKKSRWKHFSIQFIYINIKGTVISYAYIH